MTITMVETEVTCIVCGMPSSGAHSCYICKGTVHTICAISIAEVEGFGMKVMCNMYAQTKNIVEGRAAAKESLKEQGSKMINLFDNIHPAAEIGDNVLIPVPEVDRGQSDSRNVLGVILSVIDNDFYKIGTIVGTLK